MFERVKRDGGNEYSVLTPTRHLQLIVYASLFAFAVLAAYGFYLIQSLTTNVADMTKQITIMTGSVTTNMKTISMTMGGIAVKMDSLIDNTSSMSGTMGDLASHTNDMSTSVAHMKSSTGAMADSIVGMQGATDHMAATTHYMQRDLWSLNQNISTPLSMFNKFMPWSNNSMGRFPGSPSPTSYYPYYYPPVMNQWPENYTAELPNAETDTGQKADNAPLTDEQSTIDMHQMRSAAWRS